MNSRTHLDVLLAEYVDADDRKRAELQFRLVLSIATEQGQHGDQLQAHEQRITRHGQRITAIEQGRVSASPDDSGLHELHEHELHELRDSSKFWRRLAVTFVAGVFSALVIAGAIGVGRLLLALARG